MLLVTDFSNANRVARIAAHEFALKAILASGEPALAEKVKLYQATPMGQGLPSTNENPRGWTDNAWSDPAFAGWIADSSGLMQPPTNETPAPVYPANESDLWRNAAVGDVIKRWDGKKYMVETNPWGNYYMVETNPWGNYTRLLTAKELADLEKPPVVLDTPAAVLSSLAGYLTGRLAKTAEPDRQEELQLALSFLATLK